MPKNLSIKRRLRLWLTQVSQQQVNGSWSGRLKHRLADPQLWHFNRHNVAKGAALGLFIAFIPLPIQIILAILGALIFRVNLPTTVVFTWFTNPLTFVPVLYLSYRVGSLFISSPAKFHLPNYVKDLGTWAWITESWQWLITLGKPILIGSPILAVIAACLGYSIITLLWRTHTWFERKKRKQARLH